MVRRIVKYGDPVLETLAQPVSKFATPELRQLVDDMFETMYDAKGVGLAAPQVGVSQRVSVIDTSVGETAADKIVLINPKVTFRSGSQTGEEGCLSIPGFREAVTRAETIKVIAKDVDGSAVEYDAKELLARAVLHEIDHLDGILFLNHLSTLKRDMIRRKIRKLQKSGEWD